MLHKQTVTDKVLVTAIALVENLVNGRPLTYLTGDPEDLATHFWRRWIREFLPTLAERKKWGEKKRNLREGEVVVVLDPATPRGSLPLWRITRIVVGPDGTARSTFVKIKDSEIHRPAVKIYPLEISD